jgi:hypothetical protein
LTETLSDVALSFFDSARRLHATVRPGLTLLFDGSQVSNFSQVEITSATPSAFRARLNGEFDLTFEVLDPWVELDLASLCICTVEGKVGRRGISCLGVASQTTNPPDSTQISLTRTISAVTSTDEALFCTASRPRGAHHHGEESLSAKLVMGETVLDAETARLSTVYDHNGRQQSASLELQLSSEDFPRRLTGAVQSGASLELAQAQVETAVFSWNLHGNEGFGGYDIVSFEAAPLSA